jgi:acetoin:2,6-dichlorophenolindophenol oxidoreductase subunit alpha
MAEPAAKKTRKRGTAGAGARAGATKTREDVVGATGLEAKTGLTKDDLFGMLYRMALIREFEETCATLYREGRIRGVTHTYQGQEAVAVGACWALTVEDYITSTHRGHAHVIAKGGDVNLMMAELMGKATGLCGGRGGSMHIADVSKGILGANGIVGGGMGIAVGAALSAQMQRKDFIAMCFFGDGAMNQGILHEVSNMAAIWKLPVVFLVENNLYGMSACSADVLACAGGLGVDLVSRAAGYGIPGVTCNGMDVIDVYLTTKQAVDRARAGEGPSYVVCDTYRFLGHHVGDPLTYRTKEQVLPWREKDPIPAFSAALVSEGLATQEQVDAWWDKAKADIAAALAFGESSPDPDPANLTVDVFA